MLYVQKKFYTDAFPTDAFYATFPIFLYWRFSSAIFSGSSKTLRMAFNCRNDIRVILLLIIQILNFNLGLFDGKFYVLDSTIVSNNL